MMLKYKEYYRERELEKLYRPYLVRDKNYDSMFEWELSEDAPEDAKKALEEHKEIAQKQIEEDEKYVKMGFC
jgi:hypothetical protein